MKNNLIQYISLLLCAVMLVIIIVQGKKLDEYQSQMDNKMMSLERSVDDEIQNIRFYVDNKLEEADKIISTYELIPLEIDKEDRCLNAEVSLFLKEWHKDTAVKLIVTIDQKSTEVEMQESDNGNFSGSIALPVEEDVSISLSAQIDGGGMTQKEDLGGWGSLSMLLPLQLSGTGWSETEYRDGVVSPQFSISIKSYDGESPVVVHNAEFNIYRNGELVQTVPAIAESMEENMQMAAGLEAVGVTGSSEITYSSGENWNLECEIGDVIDIRFVCNDEYGLGYDLLFMSWKVQEDTEGNYSVGGTASEYGDGEFLKLFWP